MRLAAVLLLLCLSSGARAAATISADEATEAAVRALRGSDYGDNTVDVLNRLKPPQMLAAGSNPCGPIKAPVWAFHITTPYDGWLYIDAATGRKQCSSLPFFRSR